MPQSASKVLVLFLGQAEDLPVSVCHTDLAELFSKLIQNMEQAPLTMITRITATPRAVIKNSQHPSCLVEHEAWQARLPAVSQVRETLNAVGRLADHEASLQAVGAVLPGRSTRVGAPQA